MFFRANETDYLFLKKPNHSPPPVSNVCSLNASLRNQTIKRDPNAFKSVAPVLTFFFIVGLFNTGRYV